MCDIIVMKFPPYYTKQQIKKINVVKPDIFIYDDDFISELKEFILPDSIFYLLFGKKFNKSIKNFKLPRYLKKIKFGDNFIQSLDYVKFPETLEIIEFGYNYNNSLFSVKFPSNLKELILNNEFNCGLPSILPENLEKLILGNKFDHSINNFIVPQKLKFLKINGEDYNKVLFDNLSESLECLEIVNTLKFDIDLNLPELTNLIIPRYNKNNLCVNFNKLPKLNYLICSGKVGNQNLFYNLPESLTYLEIIDYLDCDLTNLHYRLEELFLNLKSTENKNFVVMGNGLQQANIPDYKPKMHKQTNLPLTLKKIKLSHIELLKYIEKIPYDCIIVDINDKPMAYN